MIRLAIIIIFTVSLFVSGIAQNQSDKDKAFLVGPVKTVRSSAVKSSGEKPTGSGSKKEEDTVTYDRAGNEIERTMVSDYGFPIGKETQTYNSQGLLSETIYVDEKGILQDKTAYVYERGKLTQILSYDAKNVLRQKTVRSYDAKGKFTEEVYYDPTTARAKTVFVYELNKDKATEMSYFLIDGQKASAPLGPCFGGHRVVYTYDDKGKALTKTVYDTNGTVKKSWQYVYNDKGLYAEYTQKSPGSTIHHVFVYEFDAKDNWIKETITSESDMMDKTLDIMMRLTKKSEKPSAEEEKVLRDMRFRTTVTTREINYY